MVEWWDVEIVNLPQWVYGEISKRSGILFFPWGTPFPTVVKHKNLVRGWGFLFNLCLIFPLSILFQFMFIVLSLSWISFFSHLRLYLSLIALSPSFIPILFLSDSLFITTFVMILILSIISIFFFLMTFILLFIFTFISVLFLFHFLFISLYISLFLMTSVLLFIFIFIFVFISVHFLFLFLFFFLFVSNLLTYIFHTITFMQTTGSKLFNENGLPL